MPYPGVFGSSGPGLSRSRLKTVAMKRVTHILVLVLNHLYLGRFASDAELGRPLNILQRGCIQRLYNLVAACGSQSGRFDFTPGRSGPELIACLDELERYVERAGGGLRGGYGAEEPVVHLPVDQSLRSSQVEDHPELLPYRNLCADRLKLSGTGSWPLSEYLDSVLYLPYVEPQFLMHNEDVSHFPVPTFESEDRGENLKLIRRWDDLGLVRLHDQPLRDGHFTKVFNTYKSTLHDRQIGDRRIPNSRERHLSGSSAALPNGPLLLNVLLPRGSRLYGSITDRRDFYHQCQVSASRSQSNVIAFPFSTSELAGMRALEIYVKELQEPERTGREKIGDRLGMEPKEKRKMMVPDSLYPGFAALYQGDHLGVEYALEAHQNLLLSEGLLSESSRVQTTALFPMGQRFEGLIIDDYFIIASQRRGRRREESDAFLQLEIARLAYEKHNLPGSREKDVVAEPSFKAAGAQIDSSDQTLSKGLCTIGAPAGRRLALSILSLRAAALGSISPRLATRLAGNWVSCLLFRRCLSSIVGSFFSLAHQVPERQAENVVQRLTRGDAQELVFLSVVAPLMISDLSAEVDERIFATDASLAKGAVVSTRLESEVAKAVWLGGDKKGGYSKLENPFRATLRAIDEFSDEEYEEESPLKVFTPERPPAFVFDFVEICGGVGEVSRAMSSLSFVVAPPLDLSYSQAYNLEDLQLLEWVYHMIREGRFRSVFCQPPCTTFSPAAHPACRTYQCPKGWDRKRPKVLRGNLLAFRTISINMVCKRCGRPSGLEQPRLSKMAWLSVWRYLLSQGFSESVVAACMFGSIHRKEFRILSFGLDGVLLEKRCGGGHAHVRIEGKYTRASAIYPPDLADHFARCFADGLRRADERSADVQLLTGGESVMVNDILRSSCWKEEKSWWWKSRSHINLLETRVVLQLMHQKLLEGGCGRFSVLLDSTVARCALAKGRSSSRALQPLLKRACALQVIGGLYPSLNHAPTKLNVADDPSRGAELRERSLHSIREVLSLEVCRELHTTRISRRAANWMRLVILVFLLDPALASPCEGPEVASFSSVPMLEFLDVPFPNLCGFCSFSFLCEINIINILLHFMLSTLVLFVVQLALTCGVLSFLPLGKFVRSRQFLGPLGFIFLTFLVAMVGAPIAPDTREDIERAERRSAIHLQADRVVLKETRVNRQKLSLAFQTWLHDEHNIDGDALVFGTPPDPEAVCQWLVCYGRELHAAGKSYNKYAETINSISTARPILRRQMAQAWDLAFAWLQDEPHQHHPALPQSILLSLLSTALLWGWPVVAAIIAMAWAGVMRIGELIYICRCDLVLPSDSAPDIDYILVRIKEPKSRGRAARHQSARIDPSDIVNLVTKVFKNYAPSDRLWPGSAGTLRRRFSSLLSAVGLPTKSGPWGKPYDLGSLRPGGASWLLLKTENTELIRRRGRWQSMRTLEIYLQDIQVATALHKLDEPVRKKIAQLATGFTSILEKALEKLDCRIPCNAWYFLFTHAT